MYQIFLILTALFLAPSAFSSTHHPTIPALTTGVGEAVGLSPFWDWRTIKTEHFRITFPSNLRDAARKFAVHLEDANRFLTKWLRWQPRLRTQVLVIDNSDSANGMASPIGRFGLVLWATPPDNWTAIHYYEDWMRMLAFHEYTHLVSMDNTSGAVWEGLRYAIGDILLPNAAWPLWMLEGLAIYAETRFSRSGRGRSPYYEMILRAQVEENKLDTSSAATLDMLDPANPNYPAGSTPYFYGYQLLNRAAGEYGKNAITKTGTADGHDQLGSGDDVLGVMTDRSGARVPFFINGNIENITGKDWYAFWDEWVAETRSRAARDLERIKSQPLTPLSRITAKDYESLGPAVSPDGKWLAYTASSKDRRTGLVLKNLKTGEQKRICDKTMSGQLAFTPDSRKLVFSTLRQASQYYTFSVLGMIDVESGALDWIDGSERTKDPDVSGDGRHIAFSFSEKSSAGIAIAPLGNSSGPALGPIRKIFEASGGDRASAPRFSPDGKRLVFSLHRNGSNSEDLMEVPVEGGAARALVRDGAYNRFPAFGREGQLFFVSDASSVDNVYRLDASGPRQVTNVTTGIWMPAFGEGTMYASVFGAHGWDIAKTDAPALAPVRSGAVRIDPPPAPKIDPAPVSSVEKIPADESYSIFPSIWPRQWMPYLQATPGGYYFGGTTMGFDAVDRHRYLLGLAYETNTRSFDWLATYHNRQAGPTLALTAYQSLNSATYVTPGYSVFSYQRKHAYIASIGFPFRTTYSVLTPELSFAVARTYEYSPGSRSSAGASRHIPQADFTLSYSDAESSRLAITSERGRQLTAGARVYAESGKYSYKGLFTGTQYIRLFNHAVLATTIKASWAAPAFSYLESNVLVTSQKNNLINGIYGSDSLDYLTLRGYQGYTFLARSTYLPAAEFKMPLVRIHRGIGTFPVFFENIYALAFGEAAWFPRGASSTVLPAAGAGVRMTSTVFNYVPVILACEYHFGFNRSFGGRGEVFASVNLGAISL